MLQVGLHPSLGGVLVDEDSGWRLKSSLCPVLSLQCPSAGTVLDHWFMVSPNEELLILRQFLRFGETRPIVQLMALQNPEADPEPKSCQSYVKVGDPAGDPRLVAGICHFENHRGPADRSDPVQQLKDGPGGLSLLLPVHFSSSSLHGLVSPNKVD